MKSYPSFHLLFFTSPFELFLNNIGTHSSSELFQILLSSEHVWSLSLFFKYLVKMPSLWIGESSCQFQLKISRLDLYQSEFIIIIHTERCSRGGLEWVSLPNFPKDWQRQRQKYKIRRNCFLGNPESIFIHAVHPSCFSTRGTQYQMSPSLIGQNSSFIW